ncbi:uncharacterized protein SCODWIG_00897 [Saccharomycodes ludwigii]|uniref:Extracellular mutant protein 11 C-terminal domain-containing protein n=1 Tax=Saccharomycodes ludwigii TaxID=36035 RepID=A0A376B371_9ASCO|nr:hypothetical protein SCDLUD_004942 [Saccharomycodes ludwigii]KAH3899497.1 hypothetical protein SCDLUD_004942 [Saccharomycodes ludwigii]SSD59136.1 uncharacterized protein SCODWIG_00897 [Saccharomycodes ludwigii]
MVEVKKETNYDNDPSVANSIANTLNNKVLIDEKRPINSLLTTASKKPLNSKVEQTNRRLSISTISTQSSKGHTVSPHFLMKNKKRKKNHSVNVNTSSLNNSSFVLNSSVDMNDSSNSITVKSEPINIHNNNNTFSKTAKIGFNNMSETPTGNVRKKILTNWNTTISNDKALPRTIEKNAEQKTCENNNNHTPTLTTTTIAAADPIPGTNKYSNEISNDDSIKYKRAKLTDFFLAQPSLDTEINMDPTVLSYDFSQSFDCNATTNMMAPNSPTTKKSKNKFSQINNKSKYNYDSALIALDSNIDSSAINNDTSNNSLVGLKEQKIVLPKVIPGPYKELNFLLYQEGEEEEEVTDTDSFYRKIFEEIESPDEKNLCLNYSKMTICEWYSKGLEFNEQHRDILKKLAMARIKLSYRFKTITDLINERAHSLNRHGALIDEKLVKVQQLGNEILDII